jgi:hypothetical protein
MFTKDGLIRIKWAAPNTPFFELERNSQRFYPTKRELVSIRDAIKMFMKAYPEQFTDDRIDLEDEADDSWGELMLDIEELEKEQEYNKKRWAALDAIAKKAGFDDDAFAYTEFCLMPFFEAIVEECAKQAELQARVYSDGNQGAGCHAAANAVRVFGETIGVKGKYG